MKNILFFVVIFLIPQFANATDCPFGFVNDPLPGSCIRYVDGDGNDICDLSEVPLKPLSTDHGSSMLGSGDYISEEELKQKNVSEMALIYNVDDKALANALSEYLGKNVQVSDSLLDLHDNDGLCTGVAASIAASLQNGIDTIEDIDSHELISGQELKTLKIYELAEIYNIRDTDLANAVSKYLSKNVKISDSFQVLHDNYGLEPSVVKDLASQLSSGVKEVEIESVSEPEITNPIRMVPRYKFINITLVLIILYTISYILALKKTITILTHRRIWNVVLLCSFLFSAGLGLLLIIRINWNWAPPLPFNMLYWHVEAGTVMAVVSMFHIAWHWRYYTAIFKKRKKN